MGKTGRIIWYGIALALFLIAFAVIMLRKPRGSVELALISAGLFAATFVAWWDAVQA